MRSRRLNSDHDCAIEVLRHFHAQGYSLRDCCHPLRLNCHPTALLPLAREANLIFSDSAEGGPVAQTQTQEGQARADRRPVVKGLLNARPPGHATGTASYHNGKALPCRLKPKAIMQNAFQRYQTTPTDPAGELAKVLDAKAQYIGGGQWRCRCPAHDDEHPSLDLRTLSGGRVVWICRAGCDQDAVIDAIRRCGAALPERRPRHEAVSRPRPNPTKARDLFERCRPIKATVVDTYLQTRCPDIVLPSYEAVRLLPANPPRFPWPAMASLVTDFRDASKILTVHLNLLQRDGLDKAPIEAPKRTLAGLSPKGGVVRLYDDAEVTYTLALAEGIEKACSVTTSYLRDYGANVPCWSAVSAPNMATLGVIPIIEVLRIVGDPNQAGRRAARQLRDRWKEARREAFIAEPPPGSPDWDEYNG